MWSVTRTTLGPNAYSDGVEIVPDTKDWTWVLDEPCPECDFDTREPERDQLAPLALVVADRWVRAMEAAPLPRLRPVPEVWSPLEYSCHVRDVFVLADYRVRLMLEQEDPQFANWDQDLTAVEEDYPSQDPAVVVAELVAAAAAFSATLASVPPDAWDRRGLRGDGAIFTVESFARYLLHDPIHHLTDITGKRWDGSN